MGIDSRGNDVDLSHSEVRLSELLLEYEESLAADPTCAAPDAPPGLDPALADQWRRGCALIQQLHRTFASLAPAATAGAADSASEESRRAGSDTGGIRTPVDLGPTLAAARRSVATPAAPVEHKRATPLRQASLAISAAIPSGAWPVAVAWAWCIGRLIPCLVAWSRSRSRIQKRCPVLLCDADSCVRRKPQVDSVIRASLRYLKYEVTILVVISPRSTAKDRRWQRGCATALSRWPHATRPSFCRRWPRRCNTRIAAGCCTATSNPPT